MPRLNAELIGAAPAFFNTLRERELDLRGAAHRFVLFFVAAR